MWTRKDLKDKSKIAFKANYWRSVVVGFLACIITGSCTVAGVRFGTKRVVEGPNVTYNVSPSQAIAILGIISGVAFFTILIVLAIKILVINPLSIGCSSFFLYNRRNSNTDLNRLEAGFTPNYKNCVKATFMTCLFIDLWSLLFVIPGIYKAYQYRMVPYILSEDPNVTYQDAQARSTEMMNGHKWNAFVLDLSFIGWEILGGLTMGILNLFYVNPYIQATNAELYVALAYPEESATIEAGEPRAKVVEFEVEPNNETK